MSFIALATALRHRVVRPINLLVDHCDAISQGQHDAQVSYDRNDEIGLLATAFNRMSTAISDDIERAAAPVFKRIDQLSSEREVFLEKSGEILLQVEDKIRVYEAISEEISARFVLLEAWALDWSLLLRWVPTFVEVSDSEQQQLRTVNSEELSLSTATLTLQTLSSYILPLLYGLLGACAHILRTLTKQIQRVTFSADSLVAFRLRWPLGMLAGISVGWFFGPETLPAGLSALQPLALAFLAGYSVELLFTAMDKLVGVLDTTGRPAPEAAAGRSRVRRSASA